MSSALSSVRTRRTQQQPPVTAIASGASQLTPPQTVQAASQSVSSVGVSGTATLQQIIEIYGKRLNALESWTQQQQQLTKSPATAITLPQIHELIQSKLKTVSPVENVASQNEVIKEWDTRFELIAQELADLKDIVLHLQDYTMSVNKSLIDKWALSAPMNSTASNAISFEYALHEDTSSDSIMEDDNSVE